MITFTVLMCLMVAVAVLILAPISAGLALLAVDVAIACGLVAGLVKLLSKKKGD